MPQIIKKITIPPLIGMILFGFIARNFFGDVVDNHYPDKWASWIRTCLLSLLQMISGTEMEFKGNYLSMLTLFAIP